MPVMKTCFALTPGDYHPARHVPDSAQLRTKDVLFALALAAAWVALVRPGPLALPYFWDEGDVYVPGSKWVAEHGLDVTPGVFPDDYSRGHPPLLYLLAAVAFSIFGTAPVVGHLVVLPFTVVALAGTYLLGATLFGRLAGALAALLLATTPLFMSIGNMLLPEMPLTALAVLSLLAYARGRLGVSVALSCVAVWVKETGIFAPAAIGVAVLYDAWRNGTLRTKATLGRAALTALPLAALAAFFVWQKIYAGYYVFPHHQDLFVERPLGLANVLTVFPSTLAWHGRIVAVVAAALALALGGRPALRALLSPRAPSAPDGQRQAPGRDAVLVACLALLAGNALFFTKMFWLERYVLPAHPGIVVCLAGALLVGFEHARSRSAVAFAHPRAAAIAAIAVVLVTAGLGVVSFWSGTDPDAEEHTFAYADVIATHRAAFEALAPRDEPVLTTWPLNVELGEPYLGFVAAPVRTIHARHLDDHPDLDAASVLIDTGSHRADALRAAARTRAMTRRRTFRVGLAPGVELWGHP